MTTPVASTAAKGLTAKGLAVLAALGLGAYALFGHGGHPTTHRPGVTIGTRTGAGGAGSPFGAGGGGGAGGAGVAVAGDWLGPFPGTMSGCNPTQNPESTEFFLYPQGSFTITFNADASTDCAGGTFYGQYRAEGGVIYFQEQGDPGCWSCAQSASWHDSYSFTTANALQLCDPDGQCWTYYRQST